MILKYDDNNVNMRLIFSIRCINCVDILYNKYQIIIELLNNPNHHNVVKLYGVVTVGEPVSEVKYLL